MRIEAKKIAQPVGRAETEPAPSRFEDFWAAYPKKVGRKDAARIWKTRKLDSVADQIVQDVKNRAASHRPWRDGFILNPSTYLNGERWQDAIDTGAPLQASGGPPGNTLGLSKPGAQTASNAQEWLNQQRNARKEALK